MRHGMQSPMLAASVELRYHDHDGSDGRYGIRCWRGSISVGPDEEYPAVEIGRLKMYTADLRFADALRLNLDDISAELGSIGGELFDDYGECVLIDNVEGSTMAVIEYVQLARVWRGDRIGPAAAVLAANMVANDLSVVVVIPGHMEVREDFVSGELFTIPSTNVDEVADVKIARAFRHSGFTRCVPVANDLHYLVVGSDEWFSALELARDRLGSVPITMAREDWLVVVTRELDPDRDCEAIPADGADFDWDTVDRLITMCARWTADRSGGRSWVSLLAAANDVTVQMLERIDIDLVEFVEVWVTFTDVRASRFAEKLPEWFVRGQPLSCGPEGPQLERLLHLVAVFGGAVSICGAVVDAHSMFSVFNQRIVTTF